MSFKNVKRLRKLIPILFCATFLGTFTGVGISVAVDNNQKNKINEYKTILRASGEVGNIETKAVLPFGKRQIVLSKSYTDEVKKQLTPEEYVVLVESFYDSLNEINDMKIGYNFSLCSEDGSLGLPTPAKNTPSVNWMAEKQTDGKTVGLWSYSKNMFGENFYYSQDPSTINRISIPKGIETYVSETNLNDLKNVTVYGNVYPADRLLDNFKIVNHEIYHSIGEGHIDSNMNVPKNEGGVYETYMTPKINYDYIGYSTFDKNTLISACCLRKIMSNSQDKYDEYFDTAHYTTFNEFLTKGKENLNNQKEM